MRHHSRPAALILSLACLALGPAVLADDVVHFQNGTFMKVQGYTVEGDTIKVTLGPGASMSFPKTLVESIERAGQTVYSTSGPANVVASGTGGTASPQMADSGLGQSTIHRHRPAAEGGSGEGDAADKDAAATNPDRTAFLVSPNRGQIRALGRRAGPLGEALVNKDPTAQPPTVQNPRGFTSISPKGRPEPGVIGGVANPPAEAPPEEAEPPQEDPAAEEDGGN